MPLLRWCPDRCAFARFAGVWIRSLVACLPWLGVPAAAAQEASKVRIEIQGIDRHLERNVRAVMALARAADTGLISPRRIVQLHARAENDIEIALQPFGYYRPDIDKSLEENGEYWIARYQIDPGPAVRLRSVNVELTGPGADEPHFRQAAAGFLLHPGDTLHHLLYEYGKLALLTAASDSGYLDADFDTSVVMVDRDAGTADVRILFETGPRFHFGPVRFEQTILDEGFLRTRIPFKQGQPWRQDRLLQLQTGLAEDPYFVRVEVMPERDSARDLEVPIRVVLVPRNRMDYELGAGYGTDTGPRGRVAGLWRWINRRGHNADAELTLSAVEQSLIGRYMIPSVVHRTDVLTLFGGYARRVPSEISSRTMTAGARLSRQRLTFRETISLAYQREAFEVGVDSGVVGLLIAGGSWERIRSNDFNFPTRGLRVRGEIQGSQKGILASTSFLQLEAGTKVVFQLVPRVRLLARGDIGHTVVGKFRELPPTLRYFTGGDATVRGYGYLDLGVRDSLDTVLGGGSLVVGSLEADLRVLPRWALAVFTDAGNALEKLTLSGLERSVGVGIRFLSPFGMLRADVAWPVTGSGRPRLHFSIGPDL
ncbi:MAG TPA: autotransporter assembly complex family protein [Gemmatimonadales bacterium]